MKQACHLFRNLVLQVIIVTFAQAAAESAALVTFAGYDSCIQLENETTRVILGPHAGGRVLAYELEGRNALYLDPAHDGWTDEQGWIDLSGGRFDIGPEMTVPRHVDLWAGKWEAEITGTRSARMSSTADSATGAQLVRDFVLDDSSSVLRCTQTITNRSATPKAYCHWSRTFAQGGGIVLIPLTSGSRFPNQYVMYGPGAVVDHRPADPNIRIRDGFIEVLGPPQRKKLGFDSTAGWLGYLTSDDMLFVKRFPVYPDRVYGDVAALTLSIWYNENRMCELEPIGPLEKLGPGESASFTEVWELIDFPYPKSGENVDLQAVRGLLDPDRASF